MNFRKASIFQRDTEKPEEESTAESENADSVAVKPDNEVME